MKVNVCVIQDNPVFFDKEATLDKLESLAHQYSDGVDLIVFPESFIPGYPRGLSFGTTMGSRTEEGRALYKEYFDNSIDLEGPDLERLEKLSAELNSYLVIGVTERMKNTGSLYCSMLYLSPSVGLLGVHRKIKPTGFERVIWAEGSGKDLVAFNTPIGMLGGLICWENRMPLARLAMYQKGVEIYIAPTADSRDSWIITMQHIALEGRCFVLGCNQYFTKSMYPVRFQDMLELQDEKICPGGSIIVSPRGEVLAGPLFDQPGPLIAELELDDIIKSKLDFDAAGHYGRDDIFEFGVRGMI